MRAVRARFTIRWIMETTAIVAIALWLLRSSAEARGLLITLLVLYAWGLAPMRRLFGFAPISRFLRVWVTGHLPVSQESRTSVDAGSWKR
jgi:hypothetical protein